MNFQNIAETKDIYDFIPKYVWGNHRPDPSKYSEIERSFVYRNENYQVKLRPASIRGTDGAESHKFASGREELVEEALRKLIASGDGRFSGDGESVAFSLYSLQQELKKVNCIFSFQEIKEAIEVLFKMGITLTDSHGSKTDFHPISSYGMRGAGANTTFVVLAKEIVKIVNSGVFDERDHEILLAYSSKVARQLHRRLKHQLAALPEAGDYSFTLTEIIRDLGLPGFDRLPVALKWVEKGLTEMKTRGAIGGFESERIYDAERQHKLDDVRFTLKLQTAL